MAELQLTSPYVEVLEAQRAELVRALTPHVDEALITRAQQRSARLSVRLDASPLEDETARAVDRGELVPPVVAGAGAGGGEGNGNGWARALKLDGLPTQEVAAVEYHGVRAAQADEPACAVGFFAAPVDTIARLHRRIAEGLVSGDRLGAVRSTSRAIHDGAQGMVIYRAPEPPRLPGLLAELDHWVREAGHRQSPLVLAGVVHLRLLQWQPFEAGNGRVARAASRVALRATGGDPWGLAVPEETFADAPLRYATEVAASNRRRTDLRPWIEFTAEAVVASLEALARSLDVLPAPDPAAARGMHEVGALAPGDTITVRAYADAVGCDRTTALAQLNRLCWSGALTRATGTRGLQYEHP